MLSAGSLGNIKSISNLADNDNNTRQELGRLGGRAKDRRVATLSNAQRRQELFSSSGSWGSWKGFTEQGPGKELGKDKELVQRGTAPVSPQSSKGFGFSKVSNSNISRCMNSSLAAGGQYSLAVAKFKDNWPEPVGDDANSVYVKTGEAFSSGYAGLRLDRQPGRLVKVLNRDDADSGIVYMPAHMRRNLGAVLGENVSLIERHSLPVPRLDSVALEITRVISSGSSHQSVRKSWQEISQAFLQMCKKSDCPLIDSHSYVFTDGDCCFVAKARFTSNGAQDDQEFVGGLLLDSASVTRITTSGGASKMLEISDIPLTVNIRNLAKKFDFDGEPYGIGGANAYIRQFVNAFISPRLLSTELQGKIKSNITRGGILSGPPGTGKTLFIGVIESLLKENGFSVSTKIISGPEVFSRYVGDAEQNVRAIFSDASAENNQTIRLILIDEIDSMLPARGRAGDSGTGDKVVNQFLTCLDGVDKKNNLIVFGTTNRPDLIDQAVLRPGRMDMKMQFNLPQQDQRLQILRIQARDLSDVGMLNADVSFEDLAERTGGFSGAELAALVEKARISALRKAQGLEEGDTFFRPHALSQLDALDVSQSDFDWAFTQVRPQFGQQNFMSLAGKDFTYPGYSEDMVNGLQHEIDLFKKDETQSALRILIKGPQGSGKSTLAALVKQGFGSFCSYVSAKDVVRSSSRLRPLNDAFAERNNHQADSDCNYTVILDDFDTMINFDGSQYDPGMVSVLDAHTKQSLRGLADGKLLTLVTATEHQSGSVDFLPRLFPQHLVFTTGHHLAQNPRKLSEDSLPYCGGSKLV